MMICCLMWLSSRLALLFAVNLIWSINSFAQEPTTFQYIYDSRNQLVRAIDSTGIVLTYTYDEVGNILAVSRTSVGNLPPPSITSVTPNQVNQDSTATLVISGSGLLGGKVTTTHSGITVKGAFGSDTKLTVNLAIAATATLGPARLTLTTVTGSAPIDITVLGPIPRITNVVPSSGPSTGGTAVTLSGSNFTTGTTVTF